MIKVAEDLILQLKELEVVLMAKDDLVGNMPTEKVINFIADRKNRT
jgi:hypothetical protein